MSTPKSRRAKIQLMYQRIPKYQRYIGFLLLFYLLFLLSVNQLTPYLVKKYAPDTLSELLGRPVQLGDITINPFTFDTQVSQFAIHETSSADFIGFSTLSFDLRFWHSLSQMALSINNVNLQGPYVNIESFNEQTDGLRFNFSDIIDKLTASTSEEQTQAEQDAQPKNDSPLPHVLVNNISIEKGRLSYHNLTLGTGLNYPDLNIDIKSFDTRATLSNQQMGNHFDIALTGAKGGSVATQGRVQLKPLSVKGHLAITKVDLTQFWSFIDKQVDAQLQTGSISFETDFNLFEQQDPLQPIGFNLNNASLAVDDLHWVNGVRDLVSLSSIAVQPINIDANQRSIDIGKISSHGLQVHATLSQQGLNLQKDFNFKNNQSPAVSKQAAANTAPDTEAEKVHSQAENSALFDIPELPWSIAVNQLQISDYAASLTDNKIANDSLWEITDFKLSTGSFTDKLADPIDYQLSFNINQQGQFNSAGALDVRTPQLQADWSIKDFNLAALQPYLSPYLNIDLKQGDLSVNSQLVSNLSQQAQVNLDASIDNLQVQDKLQDLPLLEWQKVQLNQADFNLQQKSLNIASIDLMQPFARIVIAEDKQTNFADLIVNRHSEGGPSNISDEKSAQDNANKASTTAPQGTTADPQPLTIAIAQINVSDGATFFADNSLSPKFAASIEQVNGQISEINSNADSIARVDINGKIDKYAPVKLKGKLNPLLSNPYLDLNLSFKHVELTSVNPYSGTYAGYYIDKGQLSLDLNYQLQDNQLVGSNHMIVDQLKLGEPTDSSLATTLPVTLAIALLQDRHGIIDLGVDVSGDVNDPEFGIGSVILTAFTNIITKAVTAPFALLGDLFGEDEQLDKVSFAAGNSEIDDYEQSKLATLAKALTDRPKLMVNVEGAVNALDDSAALKQATLNQQLFTMAGQANSDSNQEPLLASNIPTSGELSNALQRLYTQQTQQAPELLLEQVKQDNQQAEISEEQILRLWHIAMYNLTLNTLDISPAQLGQLAAQRAKAVKAYLVDQQSIAASRIFLLDSQVDTISSEAIAQLTLDAQ